MNVVSYLHKDESNDHNMFFPNIHTEVLKALRDLKLRKSVD